MNNLFGGLGIVSTKPRSSGKKIIIIIGVIILVILLVVLGKKIHSNLNNDKFLGENTKDVIPYIHSGKMNKKIPSGRLPAAANSNEYNYNFWIYINDYSYRYNYDKCVLVKGLEYDLAGASPGVWLLKKNNTLRVSIGLQNEDQTGVDALAEDNSGCDVEKSCGKNTSTCDVENFPIERWVNVNIALQNNVVDIYLNGNFEKSCVLNGYPKVNTGDLHVCKDGGFDGVVSRLRVSNKYLPHKRIVSFYKQGPGS